MASLNLRTARGLGVLGCCLVAVGVFIPLLGLLLVVSDGGLGVAGLVVHRRHGGQRRWATAAVVAATAALLISVALALLYGYAAADFD